MLTSNGIIFGNVRLKRFETGNVAAHIHDVLCRRRRCVAFRWSGEKDRRENENTPQSESAFRFISPSLHPHYFFCSSRRRQHQTQSASSSLIPGREGTCTKSASSRLSSAAPQKMYTIIKMIITIASVLPPSNAIAKPTIRLRGGGAALCCVANKYC